MKKFLWKNEIQNIPTIKLVDISKTSYTVRPAMVRCFCAWKIRKFSSITFTKDFRFW